MRPLAKMSLHCPSTRTIGKTWKPSVADSGSLGKQKPSCMLTKDTNLKVTSQPIFVWSSSSCAPTYQVENFRDRRGRWTKGKEDHFSSKIAKNTTSCYCHIFCSLFLLLFFVFVCLLLLNKI